MFKQNRIENQNHNQISWSELTKALKQNFGNQISQALNSNLLIKLSQFLKHF